MEEKKPKAKEIGYMSLIINSLRSISMQQFDKSV